MTKTNVFSARKMALAGLCAAFLAVISQIHVPLPLGVPITIQVFAVAFIGVLLGPGAGVLSVIVYILLGACGLPIFAGFQGGLGVIAGPAGGYIIAWPVMTVLSGLNPGQKGDGKQGFYLQCLLALAGLAVVECFGGLWWAISAAGNFGAIMLYSLTAFIPKDCVLTVLAVITGHRMKHLVARAGLDL